MKASFESASGNSSVTPRRRGTIQHPSQDQHQQQSQNQSPKEETPVLLRLPDLHPSEAMDAAVGRIEKQVAKKNTGPTATESKRQRSQNHMASTRPPVAPSVKNVSAVANWNNRIIVTTFILTVLATGFMVLQRATRDRAEDRSVVPSSAQKDLEPIPSHRINRQSFQADSRASDTGELNHKQSSNRQTNSTAGIGSYPASETEYNTRQVSYEAEVQPDNASSSEDHVNDTYDLSLRSSNKRDRYIDQPRSIRLRGR